MEEVKEKEYFVADKMKGSSFENFPLYEGAEASKNEEVDFNYSFLAKLFAGISEQQKEKIFQVLKSTRTLDKLEKTGS